MPLCTRLCTENRRLTYLLPSRSGFRVHLYLSRRVNLGRWALLGDPPSLDCSMGGPSSRMTLRVATGCNIKDRGQQSLSMLYSNTLGRGSVERRSDDLVNIPKSKKESIVHEADLVRMNEHTTQKVLCRLGSYEIFLAWRIRAQTATRESAYFRAWPRGLYHFDHLSNCISWQALVHYRPAMLLSTTQQA
ncbi:hypothetical protein PV04_01435 [Phialophora macrospora]|uniref:Uncharacterized protein n=1 Tax=Phialophora macrospora TaxID=1851006 RepID=A0A0D2GLM7_9EURO|nr:hypothetical protein PV04_01435 [Phialophora macrospora]